MTSIPVICDRCRAEGMAGDPVFAAIPDILAFDPVPRRTHVNNWTAEHQRAFIAALAITGSPRQAARAIGRHAFGAEQLRSARGGRSFAAAWSAAMDLAREREFALIHSNLGSLAERQAAIDATMVLALPPSRDAIRPGYDPDLHDESRPDYLDAVERVRMRMANARRIYLACISGDPEKRAAWELLSGPTDWDKELALETPPEPPVIEDPMFPEDGMPRMRDADMALVADAGLLAEFTGGPDAMQPIRIELALIAEMKKEGKDWDAIWAHIEERRRLKKAGWTEDEAGNLFAPVGGQGKDERDVRD